MNKKILIAPAVLAAASLSFGFVTWQGDEEAFQIITEYGDEATAGYWYTYADDADGGASSVTWPTAKGNEYDDNALDPIIMMCNGVCGNYSLNAGTLTYDPFVGIGFNVAGEDAGTPQATDATSMGGVCIAYSVDIGASLEMGLGDAGDKTIAYDNPFVSLTKSPTGTVKEFTWAQFKQAGWGKTNGGETIDGDAAAAKLVSLKFKIQGKTGSTGAFNIMSFGANGGGCKVTAGLSGAAIGAKAAQASLKAQLSGRTLSFGKTVAKAEVLNLQGQVVASASSVKSMNLSSLQAGVYMVRAAGQSVDFSQKIILK